MKRHPAAAVQRQDKTVRREAVFGTTIDRLWKTPSSLVVDRDMAESPERGCSRGPYDPWQT